MISTILRQTSASILSRKQLGYQRFLHRIIDFKEQLIGIKGARGRGKTTLLLQHAQNSQREAQRILYIACDHPAMIDVNLFELAQKSCSRFAGLSNSKNTYSSVPTRFIESL